MEVNDIPVVYIVSENGPQGAEEAFKKLEDAINWQLKDRKCYGTLTGDEYCSYLAIIGTKEVRFSFLHGRKYKRKNDELVRAYRGYCTDE